MLQHLSSALSRAGSRRQETRRAGVIVCTAAVTFVLIVGTAIVRQFVLARIVGTIGRMSLVAAAARSRGRFLGELGRVEVLCVAIVFASVVPVRVTRLRTMVSALLVLHHVSSGGVLLGTTPTIVHALVLVVLVAAVLPRWLRTVRLSGVTGRNAATFVHALFVDSAETASDRFQQLTVGSSAVREGAAIATAGRELARLHHKDLIELVLEDSSTTLAHVRRLQRRLLVVLERRRRVLLGRWLPLAEARRVVVSFSAEPHLLLTFVLAAVALRLTARVVVLAVTGTLRRHCNVSTVLIVAGADESGWLARLVLLAVLLARVRDAGWVVAIVGTPSKLGCEASLVDVLSVMRLRIVRVSVGALLPVDLLRAALGLV